MFNTIKINGKEVEYKRITNCINGNPRYLIHFLYVANDYNEALNISRQVGGKKYKGKDFGGGIVISSYNLASDLSQIIK